jgi:hypothetical protein
LTDAVVSIGLLSLDTAIPGILCLQNSFLTS